MYQTGQEIKIAKLNKMSYICKTLTFPKILHALGFIIRTDLIHIQV